MFKVIVISKWLIFVILYKCAIYHVWQGVFTEIFQKPEMNTLSRPGKEITAKEEHTTNINNKTYKWIKAKCKGSLQGQYVSSDSVYWSDLSFNSFLILIGSDIL